MPIARTARVGVLAAIVAFATSGCSWTGLNGMALPFTKGGGDDRIEITVKLDNAANLVANSEVKYDEVTVGSVRKIELDNWTVTLTVGLDPDQHVPADVTASVAQKSLLGAEYLKLADPKGAAQASESEELASGDVIGLDRTGRYPETEEVLAAGAMLLNGGGLPQVRSIAQELNTALTGRTRSVRAFMKSVADFTGHLDGQRNNITATLGQLDRLARTVSRDKTKIAHALDTLPQGMDVIEQERALLVRALRSVDGFGKVADRVIGSTKADLAANLNNLTPITAQLARNGKVIARNGDLLGYPLLVRESNNLIFGDYINLIADIKVSGGDIARDWLGGTPLDGLFNGILGSPLGAADDAPGSLGGLLGPDGLLGDNGLVGGDDGILGGDAGLLGPNGPLDGLLGKSSGSKEAAQ
jgi:phospholipid/cholesterol/gamma-HCH transport system substrate-binding protein